MQFRGGCMVLALVLAFLVPSAVSAQQRLATAGRVLDPAGQPVAEATVTFVGAVAPLWDKFEPADHIEVVTDANGRFLARLLEWGDYVAWAAGPEAADGGCWVSRPRDVRPGEGVEIALVKNRPPERMSVTGLAAWDAIDPLTVEVALSTGPLHRRRVDVVDGVAQLPPRPVGMHRLAFARNANGAIVCAARSFAGRDGFAFEIREPGQIPVRVVDETGKPVADATIRVDGCGDLWGRRSHGVTGTMPLCAWRVLGKTDANGEVTVTVAREERGLVRGAGVLMASRAGYRASLGGWRTGVIVNGAGARGVKDVLPFTLERGDAWGGRILGNDGAGAAGVPLQLTGRILITLAPGSLTYFDWNLSTKTAADGTFAFDGIPDGLGNCLLHVGMHVERSGARMRPPALHAVDFGKPLQLDVRRLRTVSIRVLDPGGEPARGARVVLVSLPMDGHIPDASTYSLRLDQRGCASVPVQDGRWQMMAIDREGSAMEVLQLRADRQLELRMRAHERVVGRVRVDDGCDLAEVSYSINGVMSNLAAKDEGLTPSLARMLNQWLCEGMVIGEDGAFCWPFVAGATPKYTGLMQLDRAAQLVHLVPDGPELEVDLRSR